LKVLALKLVASVVGACSGALAGLVGPPLVAAIFNLGSGSYEDVLFFWFVLVPLGFVLGGVGGYRLASLWRPE